MLSAVSHEVIKTACSCKVGSTHATSLLLNYVILMSHRSALVTQHAVPGLCHGSWTACVRVVNHILSSMHDSFLLAFQCFNKEKRFIILHILFYLSLRVRIAGIWFEARSVSIHTWRATQSVEVSNISLRLIVMAQFYIQISGDIFLSIYVGEEYKVCCPVESPYLRQLGLQHGASKHDQVSTCYVTFTALGMSHKFGVYAAQHECQL